MLFPVGHIGGSASHPPERHCSGSNVASQCPATSGPPRPEVAFPSPLLLLARPMSQQGEAWRDREIELDMLTAASAMLRMVRFEGST